MKAIRLIIAVLAVFSSLVWLAPPVPVSAQAADFPVANGHFYTQTSNVPGLGYRITNEGGMLFWDAFQRFGGVDALGYPMSRRFVLDGFTVQATQRAILQWNPASGTVALVNVLDRLHDAGLDSLLAACCATPPQLPPAFDTGKTWERIVADRLALLDVQPALRAVYFAVPNPLERYGLPTSQVTDLGNHFSVRAQRAILQLWKVDVPWARAGQVTIANAGDLARTGGLIPLTALAPEQPAGGLESPGPLTPQQLAALSAAADRVRPATVQVFAAPSSAGTGVIISADGLVLTANHVIEGSTRFGVLLPDGRRFSASLVSHDPFFDVALLRLAGASNLPLAEIGSSAAASRGDPVVALGYGVPTPHELDVNPGRVLALGSSRRPGEAARISFLVSDVGLTPGFSGGPLVDLQGRVIGINTAVVTAPRGGLLPGHSLAVAVDVALPAVRSMANALPSRASNLGVAVADLPEELAAAYGLGASSGALIIRVAPRSAAEAARLTPGDIVTAADGRAIHDHTGLVAALDTGRGRITLAVLSPDGVWRLVEVLT